MIAFPPVLNVRARRPVPDKAIFWPTANGFGDNPQNTDSIRFPGLSAIKARKAAMPPEPLWAFVEEVALARERVLILDDFLFKPEGGALQDRLDQVLSWFPDNFGASDVRLLTSSVGDKIEEKEIEAQCNERARQISNTRAYAPGLTIRVRFTLQTYFPYVHDRFAIIDDDLWHFGATVGGLHGQVNAATRGWVAEDHGAWAFFDMAWDGDGDLSRWYDKRTKKKR